MKRRRTSLELSLLRERKAERRQILILLSKLSELDWVPDLSFRRRQFLRRIDMFKRKGKSR